MGLLFKKFKTKFRYALKPLFAFLAAKRKDQSMNEWKNLFERTKASVMANPIEYLGTELPEESTLLRDIVDEIFLEFLKEIAYHEAASEQSTSAF
jgi:hypothetical protein